MYSLDENNLPNKTDALGLLCGKGNDANGPYLSFTDSFWSRHEQKILFIARCPKGCELDIASLRLEVTKVWLCLITRYQLGWLQKLWEVDPHWDHGHGIAYVDMDHPPKPGCDGKYVEVNVLSHTRLASHAWIENAEQCWDNVKLKYDCKGCPRTFLKISPHSCVAPHVW